MGGWVGEFCLPGSCPILHQTAPPIEGWMDGWVGGWEGGWEKRPTW